jgi:alpha-ketoglutarate-dependent sulfate ester dioxygenase
VATSVEVRPAITRLAGRLGAVISDVDASEASDEVVGAIRQALLEHRVVFLRDQQLDYEKLVAFGQRFGPLTLGHPTIASPDGQPLLEEIDSHKGGAANQWHTDVTFVDRPPAFTLLYGVVIPEVGGDTIWANTVAAYEALPPELRDLADKLRVIHSNAFDYGQPELQPEDESEVVATHRAQFLSTAFKTEHPLVRVHPETGERSLVLGGFASTIPGLRPAQGRDLIGIFQDYVTRPRNTVRWRWRVGDLAIWDNRATQHVAVDDYGAEHRRAERVTVAGPVVVGVDGRESKLLAGDASAYYAGQA